MHRRVTLVKETNLCRDFTNVTSSPTTRLSFIRQQQPSTQGVIHVLSGAKLEDGESRC